MKVWILNRANYGYTIFIIIVLLFRTPLFVKIRQIWNLTISRRMTLPLQWSAMMIRTRRMQAKKVNLRSVPKMKTTTRFTW